MMIQYVLRTVYHALIFSSDYTFETIRLTSYDLFAMYMPTMDSIPKSADDFNG